MFRNQYDTDVTTWSPQGRLFQVEYAMEAVKQGSCAVGLRSNDYVVLATLKRSESELASHQRKVFKIDDHMGIAIAGLNADGRVLCRFMRNECLNHRFVYESPLPVGRLVRVVADKHQVCTQRSWKRPYGVGLLVGGYDATGAHLFNTCPSGNYYEYKAMAIGARAQAAKTYLEKHFESFTAASLDDLIRHGLHALAGSLSEGELTAANTSVAVVGKGVTFTILEGDKLADHIAAVKNEGGGEAPMAVEPPAAGAGAGGAAAGPPDEPPAAAAAAAGEAAAGGGDAAGAAAEEEQEGPTAMET